MVTSYNIFICAIVCLGSYTFGYSFAVFSTSIGVPGFYEYMNLDPTSDYTANIIGATNALFAAGAAFGSLFQGWLGDAIGRRRAFQVAAAWSAVGGALFAGAVNIHMFVAVRVIQGVGIGIILSLCPLYITEVAPPQYRGIFTGCVAVTFGFGYIVSSWVGYGCYFANSPTLQWRLPLALAVLSPVMLLCFSPWLPESPRYLSWKGRSTEARELIYRLHHDEAEANAEYIQISRQVEFDKGHPASYLAMFKKPSWRRRSLLAMGLVFAMQCCGPFGITNYIVLISQTLGLTGSMPLLIYAVYILVACMGNWLGTYLSDKIGRRPLVLIGFATCCACLLAETLLQRRYVGTGDRAGNAACLFFIFLYTFCYGLMDPVQFIWASEIFPTEIRAKGVGLTCFAYFLGIITWTTPSPLAFKNLGWRYYFVWFACGFVSFVGAYFLIFETRGKTLEEMGDFFGDRVVVHLTADGRGVVEEEGNTEAIMTGEKSIAEEQQKRVDDQV